jgi:3-oxoacyl-[acyl-carrier protein] reductase
LLQLRVALGPPADGEELLSGAQTGERLVGQRPDVGVDLGGPLKHPTWGRIIGLTSGGPSGFPQEVSYGAAKAAEENYTMSAAQELGPYGVTANMVYPPVTDTGWVTPAVEQAATAASPLRHLAHPDDVAEVITLLASHQARYITGQVIRMA